MKSQSGFRNRDLPTHLFKSDWDFNTTPSVILLRGEMPCGVHLLLLFPVTGISELCPRGHISCCPDTLDKVFAGFPLCDFSQEA